MERLSIDRFEEDLAVLVLGERTFEVPRSLVPADAQEGDVLSASFTVDTEATQAARSAVTEKLETLTANDDGGDFEL